MLEIFNRAPQNLIQGLQCPNDYVLGIVAPLVVGVECCYEQHFSGTVLKNNFVRVADSRNGREAWEAVSSS